MTVTIKPLSPEIEYPPEFDLFGFDINLRTLKGVGDRRVCLIHHASMKSVKALFAHISDETAKSRSVFIDISFGYPTRYSLNPDGSITLSPSTTNINGEEFLKQYIQFEYPYPIAIMNPVD